VLDAASNPNLLRVCGLGKEDVVVLRGPAAVVNVGFWDGGFEAYDIEKRPGQVVPAAKILQDRFDRGRKTEGARTEEQHGLSANPRIVRLALRRAGRNKLAARGELNDQTFQEPRRGTVV
jgi:hypothetical protein